MGRYDRHQRRVSGGGELPRTMSMILLLIVLFMLMRYLRNNPEALGWLVRDEAGGRPAAAQKHAKPKAQAPEAEGPARGAAAPAAKGGEKAVEGPVEKPAEKPAQSGRQAPPPLVATGPTDEDPEEAEFVKEAFGGVMDLTTGVGDSEMPAYERLVDWSLHQPFELLNRRAARHVLFTQLVNAPEEYRGKLVRLNLILKRMLKWDLKIYESSQSKKKDATPSKVIPVYEAWGFSADSGAHLYSVVLVDVPDEMPIGDGIEERVRFAGYFFKVQKYEDGLHRTNRAPVLVGRIEWQAATAPSLQAGDVYVGYALVGLVVLIVVVSLGTAMLGRRRRASTFAGSASKAAPMTTEQWLNQAETGVVSAENASDSEADVIIGDENS